MIKQAVILLLLVLLPGVLLAEISEPILIGVGKDAKWSPDEINVSFISHGLLFVKNLDSDSTAKVVYAGSIMKYEWLDDSTLVTKDRVMIPVKNGHLLVEQIVKVPLNGEPIVLDKDSVDMRKESSRGLFLKKLADGTVCYFEEVGNEKKLNTITKSKQAKTALAVSQPNLFVKAIPGIWGKIWLFYGDEQNGRQVTLSENHYLNPRLAPTCDKFFCKSARGDLVVFDTLGNELSNHGRVDWQQWDGRGRYIVYTKAEYSHYDIEAGDIFIAKYDGSEKRQLTDTPDAIETGGKFSPLSGYLLYRNDRSGEIHVVRLK